MFLPQTALFSSQVPLSPALSICNRALLLLTFPLPTSLSSCSKRDWKRKCWNSSTLFSQYFWMKWKHWTLEICPVLHSVNSFYSNIAGTRQITNVSVNLQASRTPLFVHTVLHFTSISQFYKQCLSSEWKILKGNKSQSAITSFYFFFFWKEEKDLTVFFFPKHTLTSLNSDLKIVHLLKYLVQISRFLPRPKDHGVNSYKLQSFIDIMLLSLSYVFFFFPDMPITDHRIMQS